MGVSKMAEPQPFRSKLDVNIGSMQDLTKNLAEDAKAFSGEMQAWNKTDRVDHPMNAQIGKFPGFEEGVTVFDNNFTSSLDALEMSMFIGNGMMFLQMGADNIAKLFSGEDALSNVSLKQIEQMFPEKPFKPAGADGGGTPPLSQWKQIGNQGWDTNGDGKVDVVMPGTLDKSANPTDEQRKTGVQDVDGSTHNGYEQVFDTIGGGENRNSNDDFDLSAAGKQNLYENQPDTVILAPGPLDGGQTSGGSTGTMV
jgi:hypothetical protein